MCEISGTFGVFDMCETFAMSDVCAERFERKNAAKTKTKPTRGTTDEMPLQAQKNAAYAKTKTTRGTMNKMRVFTPSIGNGTLDRGRRHRQKHP